MGVPSDDPGWRRSARRASLGLIPGFSARELRRTAEGEGLVALRTVYLSFVVALVLIGLVVVILDVNTSGFGTTGESVVALVVLAVGVGSIATPNLIARKLRCDDDASLAKSYVQRFFLRVALAESAALVGFVGFMLSSAGWVYFLGAAFSAVGFMRLAPTAAHLRDDQEALRAGGCGRSLVDALQSHTPGRR